MKILMVAPTPFFADRGCHVRILGEAQGLQALGHEVVVCTYPLGRDVKGVRVVRTWPVPWYHKLSAGPSWHKYYIDLMLLGLVRRWIRTWQPDVVHAHLHEGGCVAALALGKRAIPLVLDYQGSLTEEAVAHDFTRPGTLHYAWLERTERWISHHAEAVITSTRGAVHDITERFRLPSNRVHVVADGVDVERFRPGRDGHSVRQRYGIPDGEPVMIYTGLLTAYQGVDLLLEALSELKRRRVEMHTLIVGYPNVERYRTMAQRLGLEDRITFTGRVPFEAVPELLAASDIGVSAKLPGSEGNLKLYTYLAAGLVSVAFDTPDNRQAIGEAGMLVKDIEAGAFAEGIVGLLAQRAKWQALGALARQRAADRYSWQSVAQGIVRVYEEAMRTNHQGARA